MMFVYDGDFPTLVNRTDSQWYELLQTSSAKKVTKTEIYWGSYRMHILVFLTPLRISVPRLEILFFIQKYFLGYILR